MKKILVIDNYDSFVHNAVQLLRESSEPVNITIQLNDRIDFEKFGDYDGILLSPGPGIPEEAGDLMAAIGQIVRQRIPVLGICLSGTSGARPGIRCRTATTVGPAARTSDDADRNRCGRSAAAENRSAPDRRTLPFVDRRSGLDARRADCKFAR